MINCSLKIEEPIEASGGQRFRAHIKIDDTEVALCSCFFEEDAMTDALNYIKTEWKRNQRKSAKRAGKA